jgi:hypothetical protein
LSGRYMGGRNSRSLAFLATSLDRWFGACIRPCVLRQASDWSSCSAECGASSSGYSTRAVRCVSVEGPHTIADPSRCDTATTPPSVQLCVPTACPTVYWQGGLPWSACSATCISSNASLPLGVSTAPPPTCMVLGEDGVPVPSQASACAAVQVHKPRQAKPYVSGALMPASPND